MVLIIPDDKVNDHINNKQDSRLCNLHLMSQKENGKKVAKDRDYTFAAKNNQNKKCVKSYQPDYTRSDLLQYALCYTKTSCY